VFGTGREVRIIYQREGFMSTTGREDTQCSYDKVAGEYAVRLLAELDNKPLDRELLDSFAEKVRGKGRVCDLGCGPGQIARYLHERDVDVFGIDLSHAMLEAARKAHPDIAFEQGDMCALDLPAESLAGIAAFYSIIHIPRDEVTSVLRELRRVLVPGGILFLAFHVGDEVLHVEDFWGYPVSLDFTFFTQGEMERYLREANFVIDTSIERPPYPDVEHQSTRVYIFAVKPGP
jgi:ubiquinone/menaquinone biosynthesis C-methylase UbiE